MLLTAYLPHLAHRNWAMIRKENITHNEEGELQVLNLKGADLSKQLWIQSEPHLDAIPPVCSLYLKRFYKLQG